MYAGMVHTLKEIHRVLKPNGTLVDLRPNFGNRTVEVNLSYATLFAGEVDTSPSDPDLRAANSAIQQAFTDGLFRFEHDEEFEYVTELDTVADLREFGEALDKSTLSESVIVQVETLVADEPDDFSIHIRRPMTIARYRRI